MPERRLVIGRGAEPPAKQLGGVAQLDAFSFEQVEAVHAGRMTAWLVSGTLRAPKPDSVRPMKRIVRVLDGDGLATGASLVEITSSMLTLKAISSPLWVEELKDTHAFACNLKTSQELSEAWLTRHPRTRRVRFVQFQCGDVRDRDWFMDRSGGYTLSPAQSIQPDAPVPIVDAHRWSAENHKRHEALKKTARTATPLADRVADLERRAREGEQEAQRALFSIRNRVDKVEQGESREAA